MTIRKLQDITKLFFQKINDKLQVPIYVNGLLLTIRSPELAETSNKSVIYYLKP